MYKHFLGSYFRSSIARRLNLISGMSSTFLKLSAIFSKVLHKPWVDLAECKTRSVRVEVSTILAVGPRVGHRLHPPGKGMREAKTVKRIYVRSHQADTYTGTTSQTLVHNSYGFITWIIWLGFFFLRFINFHFKVFFLSNWKMTVILIKSLTILLREGLSESFDLKNYILRIS